MRPYRRRKKTPLYLLLVLACVIFSALLFSNPGAERFTALPAVEATEPDTSVPPAIEVSPEPLPAPGTLLESGTGLNENYYRKLDYSGTASDLTATSFALGKERPATEGKTGKDYPGTLTVNFGENTLIKTALLYYPDDRYEIYMGSPEELKIASGYSFDVILEDPEAAELWAKEIIVSEFVF